MKKSRITWKKRLVVTTILVTMMASNLCTNALTVRACEMDGLEEFVEEVQEQETVEETVDEYVEETVEPADAPIENLDELLEEVAPVVEAENSFLTEEYGIDAVDENAEQFIVTYYDGVDESDQVIESRMFDPESQLTFPYIESGYVWKDLSGKEYNVDFYYEVVSDMKMFKTPVAQEVVEEETTVDEKKVSEVESAEEQSENVEKNTDEDTESEDAKTETAEVEDTKTEDTDGENAEVSDEKEVADAEKLTDTDATSEDEEMDLNEADSQALLDDQELKADTEEIVDVTTVTVSAVCKAEDGKSLNEGAISLNQSGNFADLAPQISGYSFDKAYYNDAVVGGMEADVKMTEEGQLTIYTIDGVRVREDATVVLVYTSSTTVEKNEESNIPSISLNSTCVDETGAEIASKYTNMGTPSFGGDGILILNAGAPVDVSIRQMLFKVVKYNYVGATINGKSVVAIKQIDKEDGCGYEYSVSGTDWTTLTEDTTVTYIYTKLEPVEEEEEETIDAPITGHVDQKASRMIFSKVVNMDYSITIENPSSEDKELVEVTAAIPSNITIQAADGGVINDGDIAWTIETLGAGSKVTLSMNGFINENTDNVDNLMGRFYVNGEKIEDVSFAGEWRLLAASDTEGPTSISTVCDGVTINISAADGSVLPAGTEVRATSVSASNVISDVEASGDIEVSDAKAFDITLVVNGEEVQPDGSVIVSFYDTGIAVTEDSTVVTAHLDGNGNVESEVEGTSIEADHFSVYVIYSYNKVNVLTANYSSTGNVSTMINGTKTDLAAFDFGVFAEKVSSNAHMNGTVAAISTDIGHNYGVNEAYLGNNSMYIEHATSDVKAQDFSSLVLGAYTQVVEAQSNYVIVRFPKYDVNMQVMRDANGNIIYEDKNVKLENITADKVFVASQETSYLDIKKELENVKTYSKQLSTLTTAEDVVIANVSVDYDVELWKDCYSSSSSFVSMNPGKLEVAANAPETVVINITADQLKKLFTSASSQDLTISTGSAKQIVFNVDMQGYTDYYFAPNGQGMVVDGMTNAESNASKDNRILWNFVSGNQPYEGKLGVSNIWFGTIVAPGADVEFGAVNGNVIAKTAAHLNQESHQSDFSSGKTSYTANKVWNDDLAEHPDCEIALMYYVRSDDGAMTTSSQRVTTDANGNALNNPVTFTNGVTSYTWDNLARYDESGNTIGYFVEETSVPDGYKATVNGNTIINTKSEVNVSVYKQWAGVNWNEAKPESVRVNLLKNGQVLETVTLNNANGWTYQWNNMPYANYSVDEVEVPEGYTKTIQNNGFHFTITNTKTTENKFGHIDVWKCTPDWKALSNATFNIYKDSACTIFVASMTTNDTGWAGCENLPVGTYWVKEVQAPVGYKLDTGVYAVNVQNLGLNEKGEIQYTRVKNDCFINEPDETVSVSGQKTWVGDDESKRPASITINLLADGNIVDSKVVTAGDNWSWKFDNLNKNNTNGETINYTVSESPVANYTVSYDATHLNITNTYEAKGGLLITKESVGATTPDTAVFEVYGPNGSLVGSVTYAELKNSGFSLNNLELGQYYVLERGADVEGFELVVTGCGVDNKMEVTDGNTVIFSIVNTYTQIETMGQIDVLKTDGTNPLAGAIFTVYSDSGCAKSECVITTGADGIGLSEELEAGNYYVKETQAPDGYALDSTVYPVVVIAGEVAHVNGGEAVVNHAFELVPASYEFRVTKSFANGCEWPDGASFTFRISDDDGQWAQHPAPMPANTEITLTKVPGQNTVTGSFGTVEFEPHPEMDKRSNFCYFYKIMEVEPTNPFPGVTYDSEPWFIKIWVNTKEDGTTCRAELEPKVARSTSEGTICDYYEGPLPFVNQYNPELITLSGRKIWEDNGNQDGVRPDSILINIKNGEQVVETVTVSGSADESEWSWVSGPLPKYVAGTYNEISYTIEEQVPDGYTSKIDGYNITNTHDAEKISVKGTKNWSDNDDQDGARPESIIITLNDGTKDIAQTVVTEANSWSWSFDDLPKYADGALINYSITEAAVEGYSTVIGDSSRDEDGNITINVTNSHTPGNTSVSVKKTWEDGDNQDGKRPTSVQVQLYADGVASGSPVTLDAENNWTYTWNGLAEKRNRNTINYTVDEVNVPAGYTKAISGNTSMFTITNTYTPQMISVNGAKTWNDNNDQDGKRPNQITIYLMKGETEVSHKIIASSNNWAWEFTDLPKYENGTEIVYTIKEDEVAGYTSEVQGYNVINTHTVQKINVSGTKTWDDNDNQDGERPESIEISLYAGTEKIASKTVSAQDNWSWSFTDLPRYENGNEIEYSISENEVSGYSTKIETASRDSDGNMTIDVTNTHTPGVTSVTVTKDWVDNDNQDGIRPNVVRVQLYANGQTVGEAVYLNALEGWSHTWDNLPEKKNQKKIVYTVDEVSVPDGYTKSIIGEATAYKITNTHATEEINISGSKTWSDQNNQDGKRPEFITIRLFANNVEIDRKEVTAANGWNWSFEKLPKYNEGSLISYTIKEDQVDGYTSVVDGYNVTNTHNPETIYVEGTKSWDDNDDQDGKRPDSITVELFNGDVLIDSVETNASKDWKYRFDNLPKYEAGEAISYKVVEKSVSDYSPTYADAITDGEGNITLNISNVHTPDKTSVSVEKVWKDADNQDGKRPESVSVQLYADGEATGESVVLNDANGWKYTWRDLEQKKAKKIIVYTVDEVSVPNGYSKEIGGDTTSYIITNTHEVETTSISGSKTWDDDNNQDGKRPDSITIHLMAGDNEVDYKVVSAADKWSWTFDDLPVYDNQNKITYTITESPVDGYETSIDGYNVTNTHTSEKISVSGTKTWNDNNNQDGKRPSSVGVNLYKGSEKIDSTEMVAPNWSYSFTNLPKYENGALISYYVVEDAVDGYSPEYAEPFRGLDGNVTINIVNEHTPDKTSVKVMKDWQDGDNQDGMRADSISVQLYANGSEAGAPIVLNESNAWTYTWDDLEQYANGSEIKYTVQEVEVPEGYTVSVGGDVTCYIITNTHTPQKKSLSGAKTWADNENQDGVRPDSIMIRLYADGEEYAHKEVHESDNWSWTFTDLNTYKNGKEIEYTIREDAVEGYTTSVSGINVTNTHIPSKIELSGTKTWDDANNQDGKRPQSITIRLLADGNEVSQRTVTATNNWRWTFSNLDEYSNGHKIIYTITEDDVENYSSVVNGMDVTNSYTPGKTSVSGTKTWDDEDNQDGKRPQSITIHLLANGKDVDSKVVTANDNWSWSFTGLDEYRNGQKITYTIAEDEVAEYQSEVNGYNVINTHKPAKVYVSGSKTWNDNNNQDGKRPASIVVRLFADSVEIDAKTVTAANGWKWEWTGLDKYKNGAMIQYSVTEDEVEAYTQEIHGFNVTNTHLPEMVSISGSKTWEDNNNQDGKRPQNIVIRLYKNGTEIAYKTVSKDEDWSWTFDNLDKYEKGQELTYTITEDAVSDYSTTYDGYNVINTHTPGKVAVSGSKTWNDNNNQDGKRPSSINIHLFANEIEIDQKTVTEADGWSWSFENLDQFVKGTEVVYSISEDSVDGYTSSISGYNVVNTHEAEKTSVSGVKTWNDNSNQDGKRPDSITIHLLKAGVIVDSKIVTANDGWSWNFTNLDKYENGNEIHYEISEEAVAGYEAVVDGYDVTNTHLPETVSVNGTKIWSDSNNQDGKRPASITVNLLANGYKVDSIAVTEAENWSYSFTELPKYENGSEIVYKVEEAVVPNGYSVSYEGYDITNSYTPGKININGTKYWNDVDDQDGIRPVEVKINLLANGEIIDTKTVTAAEGWNYSFTDLDEYESGKMIIYSISEEAVPGYTSEVVGKNVTNTHIPELTDISGTKTWNDNDNQDGIRPESIVVNLLANGEKVASKLVTQATDWTYSFVSLPKYEGGKEIRYTIEEEAVAGYESVINGYDITNNHISETVQISGNKTWNDADNQDGKRPTEIIVNLLADGEKIDTKTVTEADDWSYSFADLPKYKNGVTIQYVIAEEPVSEYATTVDGYNLINTYTPGKTAVSGVKTWVDDNDLEGFRPQQITVYLLADGVRVDSKIVSATTNWSYSFENLNQFKDGKEIVYSVEEDEVQAYTAMVDGYNITNTHELGKVEIAGTKVWVDGNNIDGLRTPSIAVELYANDIYYATAIASADTNWTFTFVDLPKYMDGKLVQYTIKEVAVEGYSTKKVQPVMSEDKNAYNVDITNTLNESYITIDGIKNWAQDNASVRPDSIQINLYRNGEAIDSITTTAADNWLWSFGRLPRFDSSMNMYTYTVEESAVENYSTTYGIDASNASQIHYTINNTYTPGVTAVSGIKTWDDSNNADGIRPSSITVILYRNGEQYDSVTVTEAAGWSWAFAGLPIEDENGKAYTYTIGEAGVEGYTTTVYGYNVTNTHRPEGDVPPAPPTPEEPTPTPDTNIPEEPIPRDSEVLGARRGGEDGEGGGVLGARRNNQAVLGARRAAKTGDQNQMAAWAMAMGASAAACAAWFGFKRKDKKDK